MTDNDLVNGPDQRGDTSPLAVIDIETTGLSHATDLILEVGVVIINQKLDEVDNRCVLLTTPATIEWAEDTFRHRGDAGFNIAKRMHLDSGLVEDLLFPRRFLDAVEVAAHSTAFEYAVADARLSAVLDEHGIAAVPMVGSSVRSLDAPFLAAHMPKLFAHFNHRTIDASALLELARFVDPAGHSEIAASAGLSGHRTVGDCRRSLGIIRAFAARYGIGSIRAAYEET